jgi:parvulin-like peptidyl-prolyl isomerase
MKIFFYIFSIFILLYGSEEHNSIDKENNNSINPIQLAKVNNHIITTEVLGKKSALFSDMSPKNKKVLVDRLIKDELLIQDILKKKNKKDFPNENIRAKEGLKLIEVDSLTKTLSLIDDNNISKIYNKNKSKYWHEDIIEASNILVDNKKQAIDIIKKLDSAKDINKSFSEMAKKYSTGKKANFGGYLGFFDKKIMIEPIRKAFDNLKVGSYTKEPIKTKFGYHILYLHSFKPKGYFSFDETKASIILDINRERMSKWAYKRVEELKKDANITYLYNSIDKEEKTK